MRNPKYNATMQNTIDCSLGPQTVAIARFVGAQGLGQGASKPSRMVPDESTVSAMISGVNGNYDWEQKEKRASDMLVVQWGSLS